MEECMTIYKTQTEVERDVKNGVLAINGDVKIDCDVSINASIIVNGDIDCWNITCRNINCWNIYYYALCIAYKNIKCKSWTARREKHIDPICIDGKLEIIKDK